MSQAARILTASEPWVEYQLDDGTLLRFRFTACQFRLTGKLTAQGDPEYSFSQSLLCETHVPKVIAEVRHLSIVDRLREAHADTAPAEYVAPSEDVG